MGRRMGGQEDGWARGWVGEDGQENGGRGVGGTCSRNRLECIEAISALRLSNASSHMVPALAFDG